MLVGDAPHPIHPQLADVPLALCDDLGDQFALGLPGGEGLVQCGCGGAGIGSGERPQIAGVDVIHAGQLLWSEL
jgi:hypothetical protein